MLCPIFMVFSTLYICNCKSTRTSSNYGCGICSPYLSWVLPVFSIPLLNLRHEKFYSNEDFSIVMSKWGRGNNPDNSLSSFHNRMFISNHIPSYSLFDYNHIICNSHNTQIIQFNYISFNLCIVK